MELLVMLVLLCALPIGGVIAVTSSVKRRHARLRRAADDGPRELGAHELAYLAGGPLRVVNTVIAVLTRAGLLRVSRGGLLHPVNGTDRPGDDLERAVLAAVNSRPGGAQVSEVRHEVGGGPEMGAIEHRLGAMGLLIPHPETERTCAAVGRLGFFSGACLVMGVGLLYSLLFQSGLGGPVGGIMALITAALWVTGIVGMRTRGRLRQALRSSLTPAGHDRLRRAQDAYRPGVPVPAMASGIAMPVALYGLGEMGDAETEAELNARDGAAPSGSGCAGGSCGGSSDPGKGGFGGGDFGSSGGDSGGDSGGGSSCGSGCGGCGGCGGG